jgi:hypothetical protein
MAITTNSSISVNPVGLRMIMPPSSAIQAEISHSEPLGRIAELLPHQYTKPGC